MIWSLSAADNARADATDGAFSAYLLERYGVDDPEYARCPLVERFDGRAICKAEFRDGRKWRYVSVNLLEDGSSEFPFTRSWVRKWRTCKRGGRYVPGKLRANSGACDYLMASDIQYSVENRDRWPRSTSVHGTNWAGFAGIARYACKRKGRTAQCTNDLGDSFKYTVAN